MFKKTTIASLFLFAAIVARAQSLPIHFETAITTSNFENFDGGTATVIPNPQPSGGNLSATVAQIVRDGGTIWSGSKIKMASNLNFSTMNTLSMKVFTTAPVGTTIKFKLEGIGSTERDVKTTVTNAWEVLKWDFTGAASGFNYLVFMFDFGNVGDGSAKSTFLFDDVEQLLGAEQLHLPVDFEGSTVNYAVTDFGGNVSTLAADPTDPTNTVIKTIKTNTAATWAGTTIGTAGGFSANIPLTLIDSKMNVRVWSPTAGTPVRLKVEKSSDPTQTCETETKTTFVGWQTMEFNFATEAPGTAKLSIGLGIGWTFNMASIFFNFGTEGAATGEKIYYFDDVRFGKAVSSSDDFEVEKMRVFPNPTFDAWTISIEKEGIKKVEIFDGFGRLVFMEFSNENTSRINASNMKSGIYVAKVSSDSGSRFVRLIKA